MARNRWYGLVGVVAAAVFAAGCSAGGGDNSTDIGEVPTSAASTARVAPEQTTPAATVLTKDDFELTVKQTSKTCYGSGIGCNVEYQVRVAVDKDKLKASGKSYDITYDVAGDENGVQTGTVTLLPDGTYDAYPQMASTKAKSTTLTVKLTDLEANNY